MPPPHLLFVLSLLPGSFGWSFTPLQNWIYYLGLFGLVHCGLTCSNLAQEKPGHFCCPLRSNMDSLGSSGLWRLWTGSGCYNGSQKVERCYEGKTTSKEGACKEVICGPFLVELKGRYQGSNGHCCPVGCIGEGSRSIIWGPPEDVWDPSGHNTRQASKKRSEQKFLIIYPC